MKKILLALNPENTSRVAIDFACYLSKMAHTRITGAFIEEHPLSNPGSPYPAKANMGAPAGKGMHLSQAISRFKEACVCRESSYFLHHENSITVEELITQSRFADLLIVPPDISSGTHIEAAPSAIARSLMSHSNCPVILAPETFDSIDELIFACNGSQESVFAMKQFTYLLPEFRRTQATILAVSNGNEPPFDETTVMEWVSGHYNKVTYKLLHGDPTEELITFLLPRKNAFIIMGAYGRSSLSRLLRRSAADSISGALSNAVFVAH